MLRFLLNRPIAICVILVAALAISVQSFFEVPILLLPDLDVPEVHVDARYQNASPQEVEQTIIKPMRDAIMALPSIKSIESQSGTDEGKIRIRFDFGTKMNLATIQVHQVIDKITGSMPKDFDRPTVYQVNRTDLPIARIQVFPKHIENFNKASEFTTNVIKRKLEQITGIGLVELSGQTRPQVSLILKNNALFYGNLDHNDILKAIQAANFELGTISVKDGNYRYYIRLNNSTTSVEDLKAINIRIRNSISTVPITNLVDIIWEDNNLNGSHMYNGNKALVLAIHAKLTGQITQILPQINEAVLDFANRYPEYSFAITRDQSQLLTFSIQNLSQSLTIGALLAFAILFIFIRGWREPIIMGVVLPISLILSFSILRLFHLTINIVTLSGLALGMGMIVDNSIIVIDAISSQRSNGNDLVECCIKGIRSISAPLISSALTNIAVFLPLVLLDGLTGALFTDQAISISIILSVSLLVTFIIVPLLYIVLHRKKQLTTQPETSISSILRKAYSKSFKIIWSHKLLSGFLFLSLIPIFFFLVLKLDRQPFPHVENIESIIKINWQEPITIDQTELRINAILQRYVDSIVEYEAEIGPTNFLIKEAESSDRDVELYIKHFTVLSKSAIEKDLKTTLERNYPNSTATFINAPNSFEQLFATNNHAFRIIFRETTSSKTIKRDQADSIVAILGTNFILSKSFFEESNLEIDLDYDKLNLYNISPTEIEDKLRLSFGSIDVISLGSVDQSIPVLIRGTPDSFIAQISKMQIKSRQGYLYPIENFISWRIQQNPKYITSDMSGPYKEIYSDSVINQNDVLESIRLFSKTNDLFFEIKGEWLENEEHFRKFSILLIVSLLLVYMIITAEFESLVQPLLVFITIPMGLTGGLVLLWISGGTLNVMSGIGLIVVLGILDNDAILKIDQINRLRKSLSLEEAIHQAGLDRLRPIVMNTFTNILAVLPIAFGSGIGSDLQRPVVLTTIGGLVIGTITALYFIPLAYYFLAKYFKM